MELFLTKSFQSFILFYIPFIWPRIQVFSIILVMILVIVIKNHQIMIQNNNNEWHFFLWLIFFSLEQGQNSIYRLFTTVILIPGIFLFLFLFRLCVCLSINKMVNLAHSYHTSFDYCCCCRCCCFHWENGIEICLFENIFNSIESDQIESNRIKLD